MSKKYGVWEKHPKYIKFTLDTLRHRRTLVEEIKEKSTEKTQKSEQLDMRKRIETE